MNSETSNIQVPPGVPLPESAHSSRLQLPHSDDHRAPDWAQLVLENIGLFVVYALTGMLALLLSRGTGLASPVWPAAGIAFALVFVRGMAYLPGILLGSLATNLPSILRVNHGYSIELAIAGSIAIGTTLGILTGTLIVRRFIGRNPRLIDARQILLFLALAGPIAGAVSASIGTTVMVVSNIISSSQAASSWFTWWVGDALGIVVFAPIAMMMLPEQAEIWHLRRWKIATPSITVLILVVFILVQRADLIIEQRAAAFRQDAYDAAESLEKEVAKHAEALGALASLQSTSRSVSQQDFARFTKPFLERHHVLQAISWNPIIEDGQRATFEASQRAQPALKSFRITERNAAGELVPAGQRPEYVAVGYIEPIAANQAALGFDVYSSPPRADAIDRARRLGTLQSTAPIQLVQDQGTQQGVLLFLPARNSADEIMGFAVGVYRMSDLLAGAVGTLKWQSWNFVLNDTTVADHPVTLAARRIDDDSKNTRNNSLNAPVTQRSMEVGGRTWTLQAWPSQQLLANMPTPMPILLLTSMLVIIFLLEAFLLLVTGLERRWKSHAEESSHHAQHDELTGLLNRRGLFDQLRSMQQAREKLRTTDSSDFTHVLMFLDLDGFKQVNDHAGHDAGDAMLRKVAETLQSATRHGDCIARIGGDEFVILAWDCGLENGLQIAATVLRAISATSIEWNGASYSVGVSIGVSEIMPTSSKSIDDLLRQADAACYAAKQAGRNTIRVCAPDPASV